jgi:chromodomain-helicase-DNA-binding protein 1
MFEQSGNQKKLEELDIDAVLANAEEHNTEQAERMEADGGEDFLKAFEFVDVKVDDLSWDEIIPKDELEQIKARERKRQEEEYLAQEIARSQPRKRKPVHDGREERRAKRRAREQVHLDSGEVSDEAAAEDPSRPLSEKEYRNLYRAFLRYGEIDARQEDIIREAKLAGRDLNVVKAAVKELCDIARKHLDEENERLRALELEGKTLTKKERKAVLFDHHGVKRLNAETIVERPNEMQALRQVTAELADPKTFRVPEATKAADYSCPWGAREDGMLCLGMSRHGFGAWSRIRDDPDLGLSDKFFLEEHRVDRKNERANGQSLKSPGAVHLVRRADYLLALLRSRVANGSGAAAVKRAADNHSKKPTAHLRHQKSASVSASPAPPIARRPREQERAGRRMANRASQDLSHPPAVKSGRASAAPEPAQVKRPKDDKRPRQGNGHSNDQQEPSSREEMMKILFHPVQGHIDELSKVSKRTIPDKHRRANKIRHLLVLIGSFIGKTLKQDAAAGVMPETLWYVLAMFWACLIPTNK